MDESGSDERKPGKKSISMQRVAALNLFVVPFVVARAGRGRGGGVPRKA